MALLTYLLRYLPLSGDEQRVTKPRFKSARALNAAAVRWPT